MRGNFGSDKVNDVMILLRSANQLQSTKRFLAKTAARVEKNKDEQLSFSFFSDVSHGK